MDIGIQRDILGLKGQRVNQKSFPQSPDRVSPASQGPLNPSFKFYYKPSQRIGQRGLIKNRCSAQCQRLIGHFGRTYPV